MTDEQIVEQWLHGRPEHTRRAYAGDLARFRRVIGKPLSTLTLADLQAFAGSLQDLSPASRNRTLSALKSLLAFGHRLDYLVSDAGRALRLPSVRNRLAERILPEAAVGRLLLLETNVRNRAILSLLYASGARVSELCGLTWRDLQSSGEGGQITVHGKGGATRSIRLPDSVWRELLRLRAGACPNDPVFRSRSKGAGLRPLAVLQIVRKAARRAGVDFPVSPHWLRHAHASHALDRGAPIHLVQATLGHASLATTGRYLHARPGDSSGRFLALWDTD